MYWSVRRGRCTAVEGDGFGEQVVGEGLGWQCGELARCVEAAEFVDYPPALAVEGVVGEGLVAVLAGLVERGGVVAVEGPVDSAAVAGIPEFGHRCIEFGFDHLAFDSGGLTGEAEQYKLAPDPAKVASMQASRETIEAGSRTLAETAISAERRKLYDSIRDHAGQMKPEPTRRK